MFRSNNHTLININSHKDLQNESQALTGSNFWVLLYMTVILLVSNSITSTIRTYRHSLPYIRVNIIIILNHYLVEVFNVFVVITVFKKNKFTDKITL